jgi:cell division protein FtsL
MKDYADGIETRNYGIKCVIDARILSELVRTIVCLAMIAGALLFYSWVRNQIINTGYESQQLLGLEKSLLRVQGKLIAEEANLRDPKRIDLIARDHLGMTPLNPNQLVMQPLQNLEAGASDKLALAGAESTELKKSAAKRLGNYAN